jgi:hypothetical protein
MANYEFIDNGKSFNINFKNQEYTAGKNDVELIVVDATLNDVLEIRSSSAKFTSIRVNLTTDTITGVGAGSSVASDLRDSLESIFFLDESGGGGGDSSDWGQIGGNINNQTDLPFTVAPDLVTFDRDVQIPQNSLLVGDAITMSDLAQSLGYKTAFDGKQYVILGYELTENDSKRPLIKSFDEPSSFDLQPLTDDTESFTGLITFDITSAQQVIGKTYRLNVLSDTDLDIKLVRIADAGGVDSLIVKETIPASTTNLTGFDFDLTPIVDFETGKVYRLEIDNGTGNGQIQGTIISGPNPYSISTLNINPSFVPYIRRVLGWVYENKEIAYREETGKLYAHQGITLADPPFENDTNIPVLVDTWNLTIPSDGLYNVHVTVEYNINTNSKDAIFRFDLNGVTGININQEGKDQTNNIFFTTFAFDTLQAGNNVVEFYASIENPQGTNKVSVLSNRYTAQKIDVLS